MVSHEATFFGSNLQTIEPLLVLHVVAVQKAFVAGVAGYGCKELWHVMGKDFVKGLGDNHGAYRGATCSLLGTLFLAVCVCVFSHQNFPECIFILSNIRCSYKASPSISTVDTSKSYVLCVIQIVFARLQDYACTRVSSFCSLHLL